MVGCMKRALFSFFIGVLHYAVFYMIVSAMFKDYSSTLAYCVMWLCIFTSLMGLIVELIEDKLFPYSRMDRHIKQVVIEHFDLIKKYDRPDLFADALVKILKEEKEKIRNEKKRR